MGYRGLKVDFPCGRGGFNGNANVFRIPISDLITSRNIRYDGFTWTKAPGLSLFDTDAVTGTPDCLEGIDWRPGSGVQRQVTAWTDGKVYKEVSTNIDSVTLVSSLTFTQPITFVEGGDIGSGDTRKLFMYSRGVAPKELDADGATMTGITAESADWSTNKPSGAIYHDARVYAWGVVSAPHNFYVSSLTDHGNFTAADARVFDVQPGLGDEIVAMFSFLPQILYVFKYPKGIFAVDTTDVTGFFLPSTKVRDDIGMAGPHGIAKVGENVFFISSNGRLYLLNALRPDVDPRNADITAQLNLTDFIKQNVNASKLAFARLIYDELRNELLYIYTSKAGTVNDSMMVFDLNDSEAGPKVSLDDRGNLYAAVWPRIGADSFIELLAGGDDGFVRRLNSSSRSIDGTEAYVGEFEYASNDFSLINAELGGIEKRYDILEITVVPTGSYSMSFEIIIDGKSVKTVTISSLGSEGSSFDTAEFDVDNFGGKTLLKFRIPIEVCGNQIGIRGFNSGLNENFTISNIRIYYNTLGQKYEA